MKKALRAYFLGFLTCAVIMGGTIAYAAADTQIKATLLSTFKIKLYGQDYTVKSASGASLNPILYNNTPYIPLQAVADGLKVSAEYDKAGKTIWIGGKILNTPVDNAAVYKDYYGSIVTKDAAKLSTPDKNYKWGITNGSTLDMSYFGCSLKADGKYNKFKASLYMDENVKAPLVVEFRKDNYDGEALSSVTLEPGKTQDVDFDISGVKTFYVITNVKIGHGVVQKMVVGEPTLYTEVPQANQK